MNNKTTRRLSLPRFFATAMPARFAAVARWLCSTHARYFAWTYRACLRFLFNDKKGDEEGSVRTVKLERQTDCGVATQVWQNDVRENDAVMFSAGGEQDLKDGHFSNGRLREIFLIRARCLRSAHTRFAMVPTFRAQGFGN